MFERFSDGARRVVVLAQEDARLLRHNYIGTEHLLLAMLSPDAGGIVTDVLDGAGITHERAHAEIVEIVGEGGMPLSGHIPFTPRAKQVLELSLREALELDDTEIGPEHILLGLIREGSGVGAQAIVKLGGDLAQLRQQVLARLGGARPEPKRAVAHGRREGLTAALGGSPRVGVAPRPVPRCSFCGRSEDRITHVLIAGGVSLCDQCARDAVAQLDALPDDAPARVRFRRRDLGIPDEAAARAAIERAFDAVIGPVHLPPADALWAVEGGADAEALLGQLDEDSRYAPVVVNDVTVERIQFVDDDEAEVSLGIWMAGNPAPLLQPAHAVRRDGVWKVSAATLEFYAAQAQQFRRPG